jgi:hypothetical protein
MTNRRGAGLLAWTLLSLGSGCTSSTSTPGADAAAADAGDGGLDGRGAQAADLGPEVAPAAVFSCTELPAATAEALLAGVFTAVWASPAPPATEPAPSDDFQRELSGILKAAPGAPVGALLLDTGVSGSGERFTVEAGDGRRLTVGYSVDYGKNARPLAGVLAALDGQQVSLRYLARRRLGEWATAFVVADRQGLAFALDSGRRGHVLQAIELGGLSAEPGRDWCSWAAVCPGESYQALQIAAASDVEIPPTEERRFRFGASEYSAYNIRHHRLPPGCDDGGFWMAWALWRL